MKVVLSKPDEEAMWREVLNSDQPDWEQAYAGYNSGVDWPTAYYWRELIDYYPDAKVLLTLRDAESWYDSTERTILKIIESLTDPESLGLRMIGEGVFGGRLHDRDHTISLYEAHNAAVRATVPPERLLIHNLGDGWEPLCAFLGKPVPDVPYPSSNVGEEFLEFFDKRNAAKP
tara:strand:+ start:17 stop:538 length:522 start_codon:yes stop_codon:yes gene_type:complete